MRCDRDRVCVQNEPLFIAVTSYLTSCRNIMESQLDCCFRFNIKKHICACTITFGVTRQKISFQYQTISLDKGFLSSTKITLNIYFIQSLNTMLAYYDNKLDYLYSAIKIQQIPGPQLKTLVAVCIFMLFIFCPTDFFSN